MPTPTPTLTLDPASTALVLIDLQRGIVATPTAPHTARDVIARAAQLAARCRERGAVVVLVHVDPGPNGVLSPHPIADVPRPALDITADWHQIVPELGPRDSDIIVTKHHPGAFHATDLDLQLRRRGIHTIVLGGISTNIGVEATARVAYELGYDQIFVEDAMAAREADLHTFPVARFFPTIGRVRSTRDVLGALR